MYSRNSGWYSEMSDDVKVIIPIFQLQKRLKLSTAAEKLEHQKMGSIFLLIKTVVHAI